MRLVTGIKSLHVNYTHFCENIFFVPVPCPINSNWFELKGLVPGTCPLKDQIMIVLVPMCILFEYVISPYNQIKEIKQSKGKLDCPCDQSFGVNPTGDLSLQLVPGNIPFVCCVQFVPGTSPYDKSL